MYEIAEFDNIVPGNNQVNVKIGRNVPYENFRELAERFRQCIKGTKHDRYFVKGRLHDNRLDQSERAFHRRDENLEHSQLFVIDGDCTESRRDANSIEKERSEETQNRGAPPIKDAISILNNLGIEFCLYTSFSHVTKGNRYRIIIPLDRQIVKTDLEVIADNIFNLLHTNGLMIGIGAREHYRWSQPWYEPTCECKDPGGETCKFKWHYNEGSPLVVDDLMTPLVSVGERLAGNSVSADSKTEQEHIDIVCAGGEGYYESYRTLIYGMAKDGVKTPAIIKVMRSYLNDVDEALRDDRWQTRYSEAEIKRSIKGLDGKLEEVIDVSGISILTDKKFGIPKPPGLLGELMQYAYDSSRFQYEEIALINAIATVGAIAARTFNITSQVDLSLNTYWCLIAPTGAGKDSLREFPQRVIMECNDTGHASSFIGPNSFTGQKAIYDSFKHAHSRLCVVSEAGLILQGKSGNPEGRHAMILDMYNKGHKDGYAMSASYSNTEDTIEPLRAANLTMVCESTKDMMMQSLENMNAFESGLIPRMSIYGVDKTKPYPNLSKLVTPPHLHERLKHLVTKCSLNQKEIQDVYNLTFTDKDRAQAFFNKTIDLQNKYNEDGDRKRAIISSRLWVKMAKFSGIATVFNKEPDSGRHLNIDEAEQEWGERLALYELDVVDNIFTGTGNDKLDDIALHVVADFIIKCCEIGDAKNNKAMDHVMSTKMKEQLVIPRVLFNQELRRKNVITDLKGFPNQTGIDIIIDYMKKQGYLSDASDSAASLGFTEARRLLKATPEYIQALRLNRRILK